VGRASEKGQEAAVTRSLIEQVLEVAGPRAISLLLADVLYADGPLLAWLKYCKGIDALVSLPEDRLLYQDLQGLASGHLIDWTHHRYVRTIQGHKQMREVEVTAAGELTSWDGFTEKAASYGAPDASLPMALRPCKRFARAGTLRMIPIANSKRAGAWSSSAGDVMSRRRWGARP